jgi:tricarballylate dehydrogenase
MILQQLQARPQGFLDVRSRKGLGAIRIARRDGIDESPVFPGRGRRSSSNAEGGGAEKGNPVLQLLEGAVEIAVSGSPDDGLVKRPVEPRHCRGVVGVSLERFLQIRQGVDFGRRRMLGGEPGCRSFEDLPHRIEFQHLGRIQASHDEAAAAGGLEEAFGHEPSEGFPHRGPADLEALRDILLPEAIPGAIETRAQGPAQGTEDGFAERQPGLAPDQFQFVRDLIRHPRPTGNASVRKHRKTGLDQRVLLHIFVYKCTQIGKPAMGTRRRPEGMGDRTVSARGLKRMDTASSQPAATGTAGTASVDLTRRFDVLVVGGGNAALCAAISARRSGASVLVLEAAPKFYRGGNTRHTRNMRCAHDAATEILTGPYTEEEFWEDLLRVTGGQTDEELARFMIRESKEILDWIVEQGVRWQPSLGGTLSLGRTNSFFLGGGRAMLNALYLTAESLGVEVVYDAEVVDLDIQDGMFLSAAVVHGGRRTDVRAASLVAAAGGFEANIDWLKQYWGDVADNFLIRGTPYNRGTMLKLLLDKGVQEIGDPTQCHAVAIDARAPRFDGGIITRLDCVVFGIVVNKNAERFYDEGEDVWPKRYAIWGRLVAAQPDQIAYIIFDAPSLELFMPSLYPPVQTDTVRELAGKLGLDPDALEATVEGFNAAVRPGTFDHTVLDDCRTEGLTPPKSHWARPIRTAPFYAYPVRPGITFTYLGTRVNRQARMIMADGTPSANMFAAGEIMAGNVLGKGYAAGIGMTIGSVFGRVAGREAANNARN